MRGQSLVRPSLELRAQSEEAAERAEAARLLSRISSVGFADLITPLLTDDAPDVRLAATSGTASNTSGTASTTASTY